MSPGSPRHPNTLSTINGILKNSTFELLQAPINPINILTKNYTIVFYLKLVKIYHLSILDILTSLWLLYLHNM